MEDLSVMAIPQQPPQQPIYPHDLNMALDRNFAKLGSYTDARFDLLTAQMRIGQEESLARDNDLANGMRSLADALLKLTERVSNIETRLINVETTQNAIIKSLEEMHQEMREGFAAQAERHNELMVRVEKLERNN